MKSTAVWERQVREDTLVEKTEGGYSYDRFYGGSWRQVIHLLCKEGWTDRQIEAVMLSKWTRWAADEEGKRYGYATAKGCVPVLLRMAAARQGDLSALEALTLEHHGGTE